MRILYRCTRCYFNKFIIIQIQVKTSTKNSYWWWKKDVWIGKNCLDIKKRINKYRRTLEMPLINLINCDISFNLSWSWTCAITNSSDEWTFAITDRERFVWTVSLSTQDNAKILEQLKFSFKRTINWNKYLANNQ